VNGYDRPSEIRAVLRALAHERKTAGYSRGDVEYNPEHLVAIEAQEKIFQAELDRMLAEGIEDEIKPESGFESFGRVQAGSLDHQYPDSMKR
jgi:hypothetical protein